MKNIIITLAIVLIAGCNDVTVKNKDWALNYYDNELDKVNYEVNREFENIPDNCLITAFEKLNRLREYGIEGEIVVIMPERAQIGHAVLCVENKCVDNGDISNYVFDRDELERHGEVLDGHIATMIAKMALTKDKMKTKFITGIPTLDRKQTVHYLPEVNDELLGITLPFSYQLLITGGIINME